MHDVPAKKKDSQFTSGAQCITGVSLFVRKCDAVCVIARVLSESDCELRVI